MAQLARAKAESVAAVVGVVSALQGTDGPQDLCGEVTDLRKADNTSEFISYLTGLSAVPIELCVYCSHSTLLLVVAFQQTTFILTSGISP